MTMSMTTLIGAAQCYYYRGLHNHLYYFGYTLITVIVKYTPRPYSNYQGPYITFHQFAQRALRHPGAVGLRGNGSLAESINSNISLFIVTYYEQLQILVFLLLNLKKNSKCSYFLLLFTYFISYISIGKLGFGWVSCRVPSEGFEPGSRSSHAVGFRDLGFRGLEVWGFTV